MKNQCTISKNKFYWNLDIKEVFDLMIVCITNYRTAIEASLQSMRKRKFDIVCLAS